MAHRPAHDVGLGDVLDLDGRLHARLHADVFQLALERDAVHDRGEHPHVVGHGAVHAAGVGGRAAPDVAAADNDGDLDAEAVDFLDGEGDVADDLGGDVVGAAGLAERLTADLEDDAAVTNLLGGIHVD